MPLDDLADASSARCVPPGAEGEDGAHGTAGLFERHGVGVERRCDAEVVQHRGDEQQLGVGLEVATSLDVSGAGFSRWSTDDLHAVATALPRLGFSDTFDELIHAQASRKPSSAAARLDGSGNVAAGGSRWDAFLAS